MKTYDPISIDLKEKQRKNKINKYLFLRTLSAEIWPSPFLIFPFSFLIFFIYFYFIYFLIIIIWIHGLYCLIRIRFSPETIYLFAVHFILNELNSSYFLTSEILVKISSLKSLMTYHPENRKIFRLSQNSTILF